MSTTGNRRLEPPPTGPVARLGLSVLVVAALLAVIGGLLLLGRGAGEEDAAPSGPTSSAATGGTTTPEQEHEVVTVAGEVLRTWSPPEPRAYRGWWKQLRPLLSPGAQEAYAFTDPRQVPQLGEIRARDIVLSPTRTTATVFFDTDAGRFGVDLSRTSTSADWLANRVVFPESESMFG